MWVASYSSIRIEATTNPTAAHFKHPRKSMPLKFTPVGTHTQHSLRDRTAIPTGYSVRSATIGFTLVARRAGTKQEAAATAVNMPATAK